MKTILLWDKRFPARSPERLMLPDDLASAAVRSGTAAAANPADAGALAAGPALDGGQLTEVVLQHGNGRTSRVVLPASVAAVAANLGIGAATGAPLPGGTVTPPPAPSFTALPTVSGAITAGQAVSVLASSDGAVANGAVTGRAFLLAGAAVASNYVTQAADTGKVITFRNTATGTDGSTIQATSTTSVVIAAAPATGLPTPQPTFTPATTTAGFPAEPQAYAMGA